MEMNRPHELSPFADEYTNNNKRELGMVSRDLAEHGDNTDGHMMAVGTVGSSSSSWSPPPLKRSKVETAASNASDTTMDCIPSPEPPPCWWKLPKRRTCYDETTHCYICQQPYHKHQPHHQQRRWPPQPTLLPPKQPALSHFYQRAHPNNLSLDILPVEQDDDYHHAANVNGGKGGVISCKYCDHSVCHECQRSCTMCHHMHCSFCISNNHDTCPECQPTPRVNTTMAQSNNNHNLLSWSSYFNSNNTMEES